MGTVVHGHATREFKHRETVSAGDGDGIITRISDNIVKDYLLERESKFGDPVVDIEWLVVTDWTFVPGFEKGVEELMEDR